MVFLLENSYYHHMYQRLQIGKNLFIVVVTDNSLDGNPQLAANSGVILIVIDFYSAYSLPTGRF